MCQRSQNYYRHQVGDLLVIPNNDFVFNLYSVMKHNEPRLLDFNLESNGYWKLKNCNWNQILYVIQVVSMKSNGLVFLFTECSTGQMFCNFKAVIFGTLSFGQFMSVTSICSLDLAYDCKYYSL